MPPRPKKKSTASKGTKRSATAPRSGARPSLKQVYAPNRSAWRQWLAEHHATSPGVWLIYHKKSAGRERLDYGDAVEEALCFGWIDSLTRTLDTERYEQLFTPRKPKSTWSRPNKGRVERLIAQGLMQPAGLAAIELAKQNGAWSSLDAVDAMEIPSDLASALRKNARARKNFEAFAPSIRRGFLYWVLSAKRPETRAKRIAETVARCEQNRKPGTA